MCGILALLRGPEPPPAVARLGGDALRRMRETVAHRGPDGTGEAFLSLTGRNRGTGGIEGHIEVTGADGPWRAALGHQRLAILDLTEASLQPMHSTSSWGRDLWMVFNGEIYNYVELRRELEGLGHRFATTGDSEVLLAAYEEWGTDAFQRMRGMWGLVLVDGRRRRAVFSRDRLGIKPLYLHVRDGLVAAVSEIKQLTELPGTTLAVDEEALGEYLATGYELSGHTFFAGVEAMAPGTWRELDLDTLTLGPAHDYWHPETVQPSIRDPREAAEAFRGVFRHCVKIHLRSDVPVGCALSGGLDSGAVAAQIRQLQNGSGPPLQTFTAAFPGDAIDERAQAELLAGRIQAHPHFVHPTAESFLNELDRFLWLHDEPVGSLSQFAGYCVARITRQAGVPVVLNGQGGDEILAGYWQSYFMYLRSLVRGGRLLRAGAHLAGAVAPGGNSQLARQVPVMLGRYRQRRASGKGSRRLGRMMSLSHAERRVFDIREMYLPRLLKWDDRNFMAFSVEGRYPFLDHELIELCLSFDSEALYRAGWTKMPLRRGLADLVPPEILRGRVKLGFETPQERWLRGPLRPVVEDFLAGDSPLWNRVEPAAVRALGRDAFEGRQTGAGETLVRHFLADRWLRRFGLAA